MTKPFLPLHMATNVGKELPETTLEREGGPSRSGDSVLQHSDYFYKDTWLPLHREDGTLPPHFGERMVLKHPCSPYPVSLMDVARILATTEERKKLFRGLLEFRRDLRALGVTKGFQWIGGSYIEKNNEHVPSDIDAVTFFVSPPEWANPVFRESLYETHPDLFQKALTKTRYFLDAYLIQLAIKRDMFRYLALWNSLFSHDRETLKWKGFLEVDLHTENEDIDAWDFLRT